MPKTPQPLFLARRAYRRRRMMDGARLLPLLGGILVMLPALWLPEQTAQPDTARGAVYLFGVWAGLIVIAMALSKGLSAAMSEEDDEAGASASGSYLDQPSRGGLRAPMAAQSASQSGPDLAATGGDGTKGGMGGDRASKGTLPDAV